MLHLVQSNKMEVLCEQLIHRISHYYQSTQSEQHFANILTPLPILVQSPGMSQWLKIRIAEHMGIAANLSFPLPSSYIWDLYRRNIADLPKQSAFTKDNMQWKLMQLLPECAQLENFRAIRDYLTVSDKEDKGVSELRKRYQLAGKIADIYDQYLVYRPDWLMAWEAGEAAKGVDVSTQPWQPELWRMLVQKTRQLGESPWHRANLHEQLLGALKSRSNGSDPSPPVFVFGISAIPKQQLEIFEALAQQGDVVLFWCNPCEHYWGDIISVEQKEKKQLDLFEQQELKEQSSEALLALSLYETGNPLLASWGKLGREFQDMLLELDERGNMHMEDFFVEPPREHLLAHIQNDILELTSPAEHAREYAREYEKALSESDNSIAIMSCHSRLRELEVLHDHLLRQLEHNPELSLGDIIVMMPDIAEYAPFIDAVFGGAESQRYLAYAISDRNVVDESPVVKAFLQLLNIHQSRFTLTEVVELFSVPDVLTQFRVQEAELDILQHWLRDSGVRWGLDAQDKQRWDLPSEGQNTWLFGLQRLLAGYAMAFDETLLATDNGEVLPYVELEGQQVEVLGKFIEFLSTLESILSEAEQESTIEDKVMMAERWLQRLFAESEEQGYYRQQILDALATLAEHGEQYPGLIDQDVFVEAVNQQLTSKGVGQRFLAGKINFCTLMPMRSIPFKQVCILGLNDPGYPRIVTPVGFDLMAVSPSRKGDRSRRYDDRYLFLEAILSTREQLYLSYIGRDEKDNSEKAPSILLTELQHYCQQYEQGDTKYKKLQAIEQPLQPFHQEYYRESSEHNAISQSYNQHWLSVLKANYEDINTSSLDVERFAAQALDDTDLEERNELSVNELISCLLNPARYFFEHRWHTRFGRPLSNSEDDEPLLLGALSRYQLSHELIHTTQSQDIGRDITRQLKMAGKLPVGSLAEEALDEVKQLVDKVKEQVSQHLPGVDIHQAAQWLDISCDIATDVGQTHIQGRIEGIYRLGTRNRETGVSATSRCLILWRPGKIRAKDRIDLWVKWLLIQSQQSFKDKTVADIEKAYFVATDEVMVLPSLAPEFALNTLRELLQFWRGNLNQPQCFFPETAWVWAKSQDKQKTINAYVGSDFGGGNRAESTEAHFHRICPDLSEQFESFTECADRILSPLLSVLEDEK